MAGGERMKQIELNIRDSNITKLGFIKCTDCEEQVICPHAFCREGCRTAETLKEINWEKRTVGK